MRETKSNNQDRPHREGPMNNTVKENNHAQGHREMRNESEEQRAGREKNRQKDEGNPNPNEGSESLRGNKDM